MPGIVEFLVIEARDLPVMDKASELTDAFVEIKFGGRSYSTEVCHRSLNPVWNGKPYKFEVDNDTIQDEPIQLKVLDYDTYSAHDVIGKVYISLSLLISRNEKSSLNGWFPIYDTLHGIRGRLHVKVTVKVFSEQHLFRQASCGMHYFSTSTVPQNLHPVTICGLVEGLVVSDDPEFQWFDRIRRSRASNEARQLLFMKLSGKLQRIIGQKAIELGGNAVLGYRQHFDLEGDSGIVVRGYGTSVLLSVANNETMRDISTEERDGNIIFSPNMDTSGTEVKMLQSRPLSGDNHASSSRKDEKLKTFSNLRIKEFPFVTMTCFPVSINVEVGGIVTARSVVLLDKVTNPDAPMARDKWWRNLRSEIRLQMKALNSTAVYGYTETSTISNNLCLMSASGTAVCVSSNNSFDDIEGESSKEESSELRCSAPHIPKGAERNFSNLQKCSTCKQNVIPDVILMTTSLPETWQIVGKGTLLQVRVCKTRKKLQGDQGAYVLSEMLPFLEYKIHCKIVKKLQILGMNAVIQLKVTISLGETVVVATAEGTAANILGMPSVGKSLLISHGTSAIATSPTEDGFGTGLVHKLPIEYLRMDDDTVTDEDLHDVLNDVTTFKEFDLLSSLQSIPGYPSQGLLTCNKIISVVNKYSATNRCTTDKEILQFVTQAFNMSLVNLLFTCRMEKPCSIISMNSCITFPEDDDMQVILTAMVAKDNSDYCKSKRQEHIPSGSITFKKPLIVLAPHDVQSHPALEHLGLVHLFIIRETTQLTELGGPSGFLQFFLFEATDILFHLVEAVGGNAVIEYRINDLVMLDTTHKNQSQCLLILSADVIKIDDSCLSGNCGSQTLGRHQECKETFSRKHTVQ